MSLFARARDAIDGLLHGKLHATDMRGLMAELVAAHGSAAAILPGPGQKIVISGSEELGFLVEIHDGMQFRSYGVQAGSVEDALAQARKRFADDGKPEQLPAPPPEEHPERLDPASIDVSRRFPPTDPVTVPSHEHPPISEPVDAEPDTDAGDDADDAKQGRRVKIGGKK